MGKSQRITPGLLRGFGQQSEDGGSNRFPLSNSVAPVVNLDRYDPFERISFGGQTDTTLVNEIPWFAVGSSRVPLYFWPHQRFAADASTSAASMVWRIVTQMPAAGTAVPITSVAQPRLGTTCFQGADLIGAFGSTIGNRFVPDMQGLLAAASSFWSLDNEIIVPVGQMLLVYLLGVLTFTQLPATGTEIYFNINVSEIAA